MVFHALIFLYLGEKFIVKGDFKEENITMKLSYELVAKHPSPKEESKPQSIQGPKSPEGAFHNIVLHLITTK